MKTPQIIYIALVSASLILTALLHGKEKTSEKFNFWKELCKTVFTVGLLYWGGFFK